MFTSHSYASPAMQASTVAVGDRFDYLIQDETFSKIGTDPNHPYSLPDTAHLKNNFQLADKIIAIPLHGSCVFKPTYEKTYNIEECAMSLPSFDPLNKALHYTISSTPFSYLISACGHLKLGLKPRPEFDANGAPKSLDKKPHEFLLIPSVTPMLSIRSPLLAKQLEMSFEKFDHEGENANNTATNQHPRSLHAFIQSQLNAHYPMILQYPLLIHNLSRMKLHSDPDQPNITPMSPLNESDLSLSLFTTTNETTNDTIKGPHSSFRKCIEKFPQIVIIDLFSNFPTTPHPIHPLYNIPIQPAAVALLFEFLLSGSFQPTTHLRTTLSLYYLSIYYKLPRLKSLLLNQCIVTFNLYNVLTILHNTTLIDDSLLSEVYTYFDNEINTIIQTPEFLEFPIELVYTLFSRQTLNISNEMDLFKAALSWSVHNINRGNFKLNVGGRKIGIKPSLREDKQRDCLNNLFYLNSTLDELTPPSHSTRDEAALHHETELNRIAAIHQTTSPNQIHNLLDRLVIALQSSITARYDQLILQQLPLDNARIPRPAVTESLELDQSWVESFHFILSEIDSSLTTRRLNLGAKDGELTDDTTHVNSQYTDNNILNSQNDDETMAGNIDDDDAFKQSKSLPSAKVLSNASARKYLTPIAIIIEQAARQFTEKQLESMQANAVPNCLAQLEQAKNDVSLGDLKLFSQDFLKLFLFQTPLAPNAPTVSDKNTKQIVPRQLPKLTNSALQHLHSEFLRQTKVQCAAQHKEALAERVARRAARVTRRNQGEEVSSDSDYEIEQKVPLLLLDHHFENHNVSTTKDSSTLTAVTTQHPQGVFDKDNTQFALEYNINNANGNFFENNTFHLNTIAQEMGKRPRIAGRIYGYSDSTELSTHALLNDIKEDLINNFKFQSLFDLVSTGDSQHDQPICYLQPLPANSCVQNLLVTLPNGDVVSLDQLYQQNIDPDLTLQQWKDITTSVSTISTDAIDVPYKYDLRSFDPKCPSTPAHITLAGLIDLDGLMNYGDNPPLCDADTGGSTTSRSVEVTYGSKRNGNSKKRNRVDVTDITEDSNGPPPPPLPPLNRTRLQVRLPNAASTAGAPGRIGGAFATARLGRSSLPPSGITYVTAQPVPPLAISAIATAPVADNVISPTATTSDINSATTTAPTTATTTTTTTTTTPAPAPATTPATTPATATASATPNVTTITTNSTPQNTDIAATQAIDSSTQYDAMYDLWSAQDENRVVTRPRRNNFDSEQSQPVITPNHTRVLPQRRQPLSSTISTATTTATAAAPRATEVLHAGVDTFAIPNCLIDKSVFTKASRLHQHQSFGLPRTTATTFGVQNNNTTSTVLDDTNLSVASQSMDTAISTAGNANSVMGDDAYVQLSSIETDDEKTKIYQIVKLKRLQALISLELETLERELAELRGIDYEEAKNEALYAFGGNEAQSASHHSPQSRVTAAPHETSCYYDNDKIPPSSPSTSSVVMTHNFLPNRHHHQTPGHTTTQNTIGRSATPYITKQNATAALSQIVKKSTQGGQQKKPKTTTSTTGASTAIHHHPHLDSDTDHADSIVVDDYDDSHRTDLYDMRNPNGYPSMGDAMSAMSSYSAFVGHSATGLKTSVNINDEINDGAGKNDQTNSTTTSVAVTGTLLQNNNSSIDTIPTNNIDLTLRSVRNLHAGSISQHHTESHHTVDINASTQDFGSPKNAVAPALTTYNQDSSSSSNQGESQTKHSFKIQHPSKSVTIDHSHVPPLQEYISVNRLIRPSFADPPSSILTITNTSFPSSRSIPSTHVYSNICQLQPPIKPSNATAAFTRSDHNDIILHYQAGAKLHEALLDFTKKSISIFLRTSIPDISIIDKNSVLIKCYYRYLIFKKALSGLKQMEIDYFNYLTNNFENLCEQPDQTPEDIVQLPVDHFNYLQSTFYRTYITVIVQMFDQQLNCLNNTIYHSLYDNNGDINHVSYYQQKIINSIMANLIPGTDFTSVEDGNRSISPTNKIDGNGNVGPLDDICENTQGPFAVDSLDSKQLQMVRTTSLASASIPPVSHMNKAVKNVIVVNEDTVMDLNDTHTKNARKYPDYTNLQYDLRSIVQYDGKLHRPVKNVSDSTYNTMSDDTTTSATDSVPPTTILREEFEATCPALENIYSSPKDSIKSLSLPLTIPIRHLLASNAARFTSAAAFYQSYQPLCHAPFTNHSIQLIFDQYFKEHYQLYNKFIDFTVSPQFASDSTTLIKRHRIATKRFISQDLEHNFKCVQVENESFYLHRHDPLYTKILSKLPRFADLPVLPSLLDEPMSPTRLNASPRSIVTNHDANLIDGEIPSENKVCVGDKAFWLPHIINYPLLYTFYPILHPKQLTANIVFTTLIQYLNTIFSAGTVMGPQKLIPAVCAQSTATKLANVHDTLERVDWAEQAQSLLKQEQELFKKMSLRPFGFDQDLCYSPNTIHQVGLLESINDLPSMVEALQFMQPNTHLTHNVPLHMNGDALQVFINPSKVPRSWLYIPSTGSLANNINNTLQQHTINQTDPNIGSTKYHNNPSDPLLRRPVTLLQTTQFLHKSYDQINSHTVGIDNTLYLMGVPIIRTFTPENISTLRELCPAMWDYIEYILLRQYFLGSPLNSQAKSDQPGVDESDFTANDEFLLLLDKSYPFIKYGVQFYVNASNYNGTTVGSPGAKDHINLSNLSDKPQSPEFQATYPHTTYPLNRFKKSAQSLSNSTEEDPLLYAKLKKEWDGLLRGHAVESQHNIHHISQFLLDQTPFLTNISNLTMNSIPIYTQGTPGSNPSFTCQEDNLVPSTLWQNESPTPHLPVDTFKPLSEQRVLRQPYYPHYFFDSHLHFFYTDIIKPLLTIHACVSTNTPFYNPNVFRSMIPNPSPNPLQNQHPMFEPFINPHNGKDINSIPLNQINPLRIGNKMFSLYQAVNQNYEQWEYIFSRVYYNNGRLYDSTVANNVDTLTFGSSSSSSSTSSSLPLTSVSKASTVSLTDKYKPAVVSPNYNGGMFVTAKLKTFSDLISLPQVIEHFTSLPRSQNSPEALHTMQENKPTPFRGSDDVDFWITLPQLLTYVNPRVLIRLIVNPLLFTIRYPLIGVNALPTDHNPLSTLHDVGVVPERLLMTSQTFINAMGGPVVTLGHQGSLNPNYMRYYTPIGTAVASQSFSLASHNMMASLLRPRTDSINSSVTLIPQLPPYMYTHRTLRWQWHVPERGIRWGEDCTLDFTRRFVTNSTADEASVTTAEPIVRRQNDQRIITFVIDIREHDDSLRKGFFGLGLTNKPWPFIREGITSKRDATLYYSNGWLSSFGQTLDKSGNVASWGLGNRVGMYIDLQHNEMQFILDGVHVGPRISLHSCMHHPGAQIWPVVRLKPRSTASIAYW